MKVIDLIEEFYYGELSLHPLVVSYMQGNDPEKEKAKNSLITYMNDGLRMLGSEFVLDLGVRTYLPKSDEDIYRINDPKYIRPLSVSTVSGNALERPFRVNDPMWGYQEVGYGIYQFNPEMTNGEKVKVVYQTVPTILYNEESEIPLYLALLDLFKNYVIYKITTPNGMNAANMQNMHYARYMSSLERVKASGIADVTNPLTGYEGRL